MSDTSTPARPRQLTMAGGFVIGGSVFLMLTVFDTFTSLQTVEMREEVTEVLSSPTGKGLGISVGEALSLMRVGLMVAAACAAAAAVLGVYALQRHRAARMALSILAVPILLTAPLTGGLVGALVVAATVMLWSGPARDWFAGRPVRQPAERPAAPESPRAEPPAQSPLSPPSGEYPTGPADGPQGDAGGGARTATQTAPVSTAGTSTAPAATSGFGERPVEQSPEPGHGQAQPGPRTGPAHPAGSPAGSAVPITVKVACVLTWVFSGVVALLYAGMLIALVVAQDGIVDYFTSTPEWQRANLESSMLVPVLWLGCLMFLGWALGACVLAWFTWRRQNWARWLLAVSAGTTLVVAIVALPYSLLHLLAAALTIAGLFGAAARTWFGSVAGPQDGPPGQAPAAEHEQGHEHKQGHEQEQGPRQPRVW